MKHLYTYFLALFCLTAAAQCPTGNVNLSTQAEVDAFAVSYPTCTNISGNLFISGSGITNLAPLGQIASVTGSLTVYLCSSLQNLNGLNISSIGGNCDLSVNSQLANITGLQYVTTIGGSFIINGTSALTSLNGLQNLISVGNLVSIKGAGMDNLNGLENLTSIGFFLEISNNPYLTSLSALSNLATIGGYIDIQNNPVLTTLSGLDNINPSSITAILIRNCPTLSFCSVQSFCYFVQNINGGTFTNNLPGCNSGTEISNVCNLGTEDLNAVKFAVAPNPTTDFLYITTSDNAQATNFIVSDLSGKVILDIQNCENKIDVSHLSNGLYILTLIGDQVISKNKFVKK